MSSGFRNGTLVVDPSGATDSYIQYNEAATGKWRQGNDATDDSFRLSQGSSLGTSDTFIMSSAGERTLPLNPCFFAYLSGNDNNVTGNGTTYTIGTNVAFTEIFDQNSDFNTNGTFTAPITGRYILNAGIFLGGCIGTGLNFRLVTSNNTFRTNVLSPVAVKNSGNAVQLGLSIICDMDASDTATLTVQDSGGGGDTEDLLGGSSTYFSGNLLS